MHVASFPWQAPSYNRTVQKVRKGEGEPVKEATLSLLAEDMKINYPAYGAGAAG